VSKTSVLINNYNNGPYLRACVESALNQTRPADEVIVYDDGSSDDSRSILRSFGSRITVIEGARTGLGSRAAQANAVHQAFLRSQGDLIFLLDGDDCFHPRKIEDYAKAFASRPDIACIQSPLQEIDADGKPLGTNYNPMKHLDDYLEATYRQHDVDFYYPTSGLAFSRAFLAAVLPLDYSDRIELALDTRLGMFAPLFGKVVTLPHPLSDWRRHARSYTVTLQPSTAQMKETLKRTRVFNLFCAQRGFRPIRLWRNRRFYLQVLRATTPNFLYSLYYRLLHPGRTGARPRLAL
jgi:glycosyltransferase involved in cell wall biosynthesis